MASGTTGRVVGRTRAIVHVPVPARPRTHRREGGGNQPKVSRRRAARGHQTPLAPAKDAESATAAPAEALMGTTIPARGRAPDRPLRTNLRWRATVLACCEKLARSCRYKVHQRIPEHPNGSQAFPSHQPGPGTRRCEQLMPLFTPKFRENTPIHTSIHTK